VPPEKRIDVHGWLLAARAVAGYDPVMPDDLYDTDVLAWSERQAELLRRAARGKRVNERRSALAW
jgi:hypothetical protein